MTPAELDVLLDAIAYHDEYEPVNQRDEARAKIMDAFTKPGGFWPDALMETVAAKVSPSVWNPESRTYKGLDKRICHTISVWRDRYGPLTPEQETYMSVLLCHAVERAALEAGTDKKKLYPYIHTRIGNLVNHEAVHAGFQRRAEKTVDVTSILEGLAA